MTEEIGKFILDQLSVWPLASSNFRMLKSARIREFEVGGLTVKAQWNPCRIISSTAEVDSESIAARPCFLCVENRPKEQFHIKFNGRKRRRYNIQVNPYPIFPNHLVVARDEHLPQAIWHHFPDMMDFTSQNDAYTVFYNGPCSGASAPDHLHFQAVPRHSLPLEDAVDSFLDNPGAPLARNKDALLYLYPGFANGVFALKAKTSKSQAKLFYRLLCCCEKSEYDTEPRFNLYTWFRDGEFRTCVVFRTNLRSHHYYAEGREHLTMSPGAADMAGFFVVPEEDDFGKLTSEMLASMVDEVTLSKDQEQTICRRLTRGQTRIDVGLMSAEEIRFEIISDGAGPQKVFWCDGRIAYNGMLYDELQFEAVTRSTMFAEPSFILYDVPIGIGFHWQQNRTFRYAGSLRFIVEGRKITAVNRIGVENYLLSVISSEMNPSCPLELLKAHAVISRSWVLSQKGVHENFDVCADDHCQRYQGLTMVQGENAAKAIDQTWGKVLRYNGEICDARYSKCCGGRTERFSACWEDVDIPYLRSVPDSEGERVWCDCRDEKVLKTILNDYDASTLDFYRWTYRASAEDLGKSVSAYTGVALGPVTSLEPLERGDSGRIISLRIVGEKGETTVGKELAIRKALCPSCLKSSAFDVHRDGNDFVLEGHGWGHGVGLCQIGAAVMASEGRGYEEILSHYYRNAKVE